MVNAQCRMPKAQRRASRHPVPQLPTTRARGEAFRSAFGIQHSCLALALVLALAPGASAQTAAGGPSDATQADPSAASQEAEPDRSVLASMRAWARERKLMERLNGEIDGWYPRMGGITRGSGFAVGPGYRLRVFERRVLVDVSAALSTKGYSAFDASAQWVQAWNDRLEFWTEFRYEDFPQEDFFGTGMSTTRDMRTSYDFDSAEALTRLLVKPRAWLQVTGTVGLMRPDIGRGTDEGVPSIEERFTDAEAPGLADQPAFVHSTIAADVDTRDRRGNPSSGGLYHVAYGLWNDVTLNRFDFHRFDGQLVHYVPVTPDRQHVVSGRVGARYVNNAMNSRVPFYFLAYVGGMDTIRSLREFRFKDENALWLSAEYKWRPQSSLSVSVFADAGETRPDWQDLDLRGMHTGYGVGVGYHSASRTVIRLDLGAGGGEGWQVFLKVRPDF
jgi:hypothetical protein